LSEEQDARIALHREFGSNARNWYNVLLAMAIVLFAAVQVRRDLAYMGLWEITLAIIFSQVIYAVIRAAVSVRLAREVVIADLPPSQPPRNFLRDLDHEVRQRLNASEYWRVGLALGDRLGWWVVWTIVCPLVLMGLICILTRCFCLWYSLRPLCRLAG
jgi:hypothetical protein